MDDDPIESLRTGLTCRVATMTSALRLSCFTGNGGADPTAGHAKSFAAALAATDSAYSEPEYRLNKSTKESVSSRDI
jgi:hypothetical protein